MDGKYVLQSRKPSVITQTDFLVLTRNHDHTKKKNAVQQRLTKYENELTAHSVQSATRPNPDTEHGIYGRFSYDPFILQPSGEQKKNTI